MASTCFGRSDPETPGPDRCVEDDAAPGVPPLAAAEQAVAARPQAGPQAPSPTPGEDAAPVEAAVSAAAPSGMLEGARLPIEQMRLAIEDGLLMVFGPEDDPVPPYAFAAAAAARPDARVALPDGTTAAASRVAAALGAQILRRLGAADQGPEWILAMLRDEGGPEAASDGALRAEQDVLGALEGPDAAASAADRRPEVGERPGSGEQGQAGDAAAASATPKDRDPGDRATAPQRREALDQNALDQAAASVSSPETLPRLELDLEELVATTDAGLDLDFSADGLRCEATDTVLSGPDLRHQARPMAAEPACGDRAGAPDSGTGGSASQRAPRAPDHAADRVVGATEPAAAEPAAAEPAAAEPAAAEPAAAEPDAEPEVDPDSIVLVVIRGVPEDGVLSTGMRDDDGSWSISPLDLPTVTISLACQAPGDAAREAPGGDRDLSITGIALAEDGELVAVSETVPLADYLGDPASGDPPLQHAAEPDPAIGGEPRMIPLEVDPQAWAGEAFDALVIRHLPAGARLSAGAYDPAIDGWVLRPQDLGALAILPPPELRADLSLTLMGIALRPGADTARILARLPVRLA